MFEIEKKRGAGKGEKQKLCSENVITKRSLHRLPLCLNAEPEHGGLGPGLSSGWLRAPDSHMKNQRLNKARGPRLMRLLSDLRTDKSHAGGCTAEALGLPSRHETQRAPTLL